MRRCWKVVKKKGKIAIKKKKDFKSSPVAYLWKDRKHDRQSNISNMEWVRGFQASLQHSYRTELSTELSCTSAVNNLLYLFTLGQYSTFIQFLLALYHNSVLFLFSQSEFFVIVIIPFCYTFTNTCNSCRLIHQTLTSNKQIRNDYGGFIHKLMHKLEIPNNYFFFYPSVRSQIYYSFPLCLSVFFYL